MNHPVNSATPLESNIPSGAHGVNEHGDLVSARTDPDELADMAVRAPKHGSGEDGAIKPSRHPIRDDELKDSGRVAGCRARRLPIGNAQVFDKLDVVRSAEDIVAKNRVCAAAQSRDGVWGTPPLLL